MSKEFKQSLIVIIITSLITGIFTFLVGFFSSELIDKRREEEKFVLGMYADLYKEGFVRIQAVKNDFQELSLMLSKGFGLSSNEYNGYFDSLKQDIDKYEEYVSDLERLGTSNQIAINEQIRDYIYQGYSMIYTIETSVELLERDARKFVRYSEEADTGMANFLKPSIDRHLDDLIDHENRVYINYHDYYLPIFNVLESAFNKEFRRSINLGTTYKIESDLSNLDSLLIVRHNHSIEPKKLKYQYAKGRRFLASNVNMPVDSMSAVLDSLEKGGLRTKFIVNQLVELENYKKPD